jgi:hypothetical protein
MAYPGRVLRGRAALTVALGAAGALMLGCSYDRADTLTQVTVPAATTTTLAPAPCGTSCPYFYGAPPTVDPNAYTPVCYAAHVQYWALFAGNPDPVSVQQFGAAVAVVGASPDVVAAAERWAQVRVDNLARHQAAVARQAGGADLSTDPDYVAVYAVFTAPGFGADNAAIVDALTVVCPPWPAVPGTR